jgi:uncharacterized beta-barrel protein YwiB (DUF1934 family)
VISIEGLQTNAGFANADVKMMTEGKYFQKEGGYCISYKETEVTGMDGTTTSITVKDGIVTILRFGTINSQIIFKEGGKHVSHYDTGSGSFTMGVFANAVESDLNEAGGTIRIDYNIEVDDRPLAGNIIKIMIVSKSAEVT